MRRRRSMALCVALVPAILAASTTSALASSQAPASSIEETVAAALIAAGQEMTTSEAEAVPDAVVVDETSATYQLGADALELTPLDSEHSVVLGRETGIQALTVLDEGASTAEFRVDIPDGAVLAEYGAGYVVNLLGDEFALTIASIEAPWAIDADGRSLPTSYELIDGGIRQHVETVGAAYPIVADPLITIGFVNAPQGPGAYLNLTGQVMNTIYAGVLGASLIAPAVICVSLDKIPNPIVRGIVKVICGLGGIASVPTVLSQVAAALQSSTWRNSQCYQMRVGGSGPFVATSASNCA